MMKTFAIRLKQETNIEGVIYPADFQVAAITSEVSPMTLLGLIQFKHAIVEEVTDSLDDEGDASADDVDSTLEASEPVTTSTENDIPHAEASVAAPPASDSLPQQEAGNSNGKVDVLAEAVAAFVAAGLDHKTAEVLAITNHIASIEELTTLLADVDFNLTDLDEVGAIRAEKIRSIFSTVSAN